ncbi:probable inactive tRNA-specific adenosine deaminase-like protein 3 [Eurytemora carolleeae]|uniref:probable inactive tRNA-specific adenosine deaminase-like protein 3 n=1 Tax=Eurytemora carolleeae TaxID=1294199 RepID=UPI000C7619A5|nr:probable inactive tRNA-specific adenosine deaminase-like protein 3 [Eurytemora carolleeae]|eukprot:XP_023329157.1 probable inactive tRNA-specific adenosine deaminase-like protein 3 [Eurytemora affinis]
MVSMQPPLLLDQDAPGSPARSPTLRPNSPVDAEPPFKRLKAGDKVYPFKPWKLLAVLGDAARLPVPLVPALAAQIIDKKQTSTLIRKLNEVLPLPSLQHLKRVKSLKEGDTNSIYLLLWSIDPDCDINPTQVINKLKETGVDTSAFSPNFRRELVAKFAPLTRSQFEGLKCLPSYWPCNFHEDKYFESLVTSSHELWSEENRKLQEEFMTRALGRGTGGGLVVDPSTNTVIAEGHGTDGHPLHHTVMNLVDLVARSQGGGALEHTEITPTLVFNPSTIPQDTSTSEEVEEKTTTSHNHLKRYGSIAQLSSVPKTGPYLCTG